MHCQQHAMQGQRGSAPLGRSGCDEGECSGECAVMMALMMCGGWGLCAGVCLHVYASNVG